MLFSNPIESLKNLLSIMTKMPEAKRNVIQDGLEEKVKIEMAKPTVGPWPIPNSCFPRADNAFFFRCPKLHPSMTTSKLGSL